MVFMMITSGFHQTFQQCPKSRSDRPNKIINNSVNLANFEKSQGKKCLRISSGIYDFFVTVTLEHPAYKKRGNIFYKFKNGFG